MLFQTEKDVKSMAFEAEIILKIEELQHDKKQLNNELALMRGTCDEMKRNIDLINGRVTLLRDENKILWDELEKVKTETETASKVDGLERHVDQLVELLSKHNISA
jgi:predicted nuclease with TOPRIM domain